MSDDNPIASAWTAPWIVDPSWLPSDPTAKLAQRRMPIFRRVFHIAEPVVSATLDICGLGHHEARINRKRVGENVLSTPWTNYRKSCHYETHDVTNLLRDGENAIGVLLGNGMYRVVGGRYCKFKASIGPPTLTARLQIRFASGKKRLIATDTDWRCIDGPITFSCIYGGEDHDAQLEPVGWDSSAFNDSEWRIAEAWIGPGGRLVPAIAPPIRVMQRFEPIAMREFDDGARVYDLGQNFSGRPTVSISAAAGESIKISPSELLDDNGRVMPKPTGAPVSFTYTASGSGDAETWSPRFSLHGFRYLEVTGAKPRAIAGEFLHSNSPTIGTFECSNDLFNRTHRLIVNAIRSNMHHVLTDCPHREKLGWLEQMHLMGQSIFCNFDATDLYRKACRDMREAQHENGMVPTIAPQYTTFKPPWDIFNDSPEWGSAIVMCPLLVFRNSGNRLILEENYDAMKRYVAYLQTRADADGIVAYGLADWYDIGPGDPGFSKLTSAAMTATVTLYLDLLAVADSAIALGHENDASGFLAQAATTRVACNAKLLNTTELFYDRNSQCANAMALASGIVEPANRDRVLQHLIDDIRAHENHLTAGDVGFRYVLDALAEAGHSDVIFDMLTRIDPPSYASQLLRGATSLTEAWDANPKSSQNHLMLGHAEAWFHETLAGLSVDFSRRDQPPITIRPTPVGDVTWARVVRETPFGRVELRWSLSDGVVSVDVVIPANLSASIRFFGQESFQVDAGHHHFDL